MVKIPGNKKAWWVKKENWWLQILDCSGPPWCLILRMQGLSRYPNDKKREKFLIEKNSVQFKKSLKRILERQWHLVLKNLQNFKWFTFILRRQKQDPVSAMQKTGLANYSSFLVWKKYHLWMWSLWDSKQPFSCVFSLVTPKQTNERPKVILVQACSWPVRRQSFAISKKT